MSPAVRIVTDANGRILEAADSAGSLFGIDDRWLVGKPLAAFVPASKRRDFRTLLLDLAHGERATGVTLEMERRDGRGLVVAVEAMAERPGERVEWLLTGAQVEAGRADLAKSLPPRAPLGRLLARVPVGIVSLSSQLEVEYVNPAARIYLGSGSPGQLLPDPWPRFALRKFARRLFTTSPPPRQVVETASGRVLELDGIPGTQHESALLMMQDVTTRERRSRAEHEFVTNAAHELRTPVAAITSSVEVLQNGAREVPEERDRFLAHIARESDRLARLAEALLLLARIQTGQEQPRLELISVEPLLEEIAARAEPQTGVELSVSCGAGVAMLADADLLRQAVWNVVANAATHTSAGAISLFGRDLGRFSEIEIRDTGAGIAEREQAQIFNRFFRGEHRAPGGFGLGLPIARAIIGALGGTVTLESKPGEGTNVRFAVPSARLVRT